jgi:hypothetical protein
MAERRCMAMAKENEPEIEKKVVKIKIRKLDKVETTKPTMVNDG